MSIEITVGICAYNEGMNIGRLLNNILYKQGLPAKSEVLVVCSGCTDNTTEIVQKYAKEDARVRLYIEKERRGKASAVNHILLNAEGDIIIFIPADVLPHQKCFSKLISKLRDSNVGIVCGKPVPTNSPNSLIGKMVQLLWRFHDHVFIELDDAGLARHASEIFCIRKGIVDKIPTETVNDDAYLAVTAKKKELLVRYEPEACVSICGPKTLLDYFKQRRRIIFGHYQVRKLTGKPTQYIPHLMPLYPSKVLKLVLWLCAEWDIPTFLAFILVEFAVNIVAMIDSISGKSHVQWSISTSTKTATTESNFVPQQKKGLAN